MSALITGRGKFQYNVGFAVLNINNLHLTLSQITDNLIYSDTISKINIIEPTEILLPEAYLKDTFSTVSLYHRISQKFKKISIKFLSSQHFSALVGLDLIEIYCTSKSRSINQVIKKKYYALSAASALLKYTAHLLNMTYAPQTLQLDFQKCTDFITLDVELIEELEIICSHNKAFSKYSLYNALNKCVTPLGKKLLRVSLLQPLHNIELIDKRINSVIELISKPHLLSTLQSTLKHFCGAEKLLNISFKINKHDNIQQAEKNLNYILLLKNLLDIFPKFHTVLNNISSSLFDEIKCNFVDNSCKDIRKLIFKFIQMDATSVQGYTSSNMQRCFAIKPKISKLLDIIRQAYCELMDNMIQYVENISKTFHLKLSLGCSSQHGYYMQMNLIDIHRYKIRNIPKFFIVLRQNGQRILITTEKLLVDSQKCKEICEEIHVMSNVIIENVIDKLYIYNDYFFQICKNVAEIDFITSLAIVSTSSGFVEPKFGQNLCIIDSYHPVQFLVGLQIYVPNNIIASVPYNFQIITGPNLCGKSTYLKQIILLHILAQIGCFIPAQKATLRICDRFLFYSASYHTQNSLHEFEVKTLNYIINSLTDYSLIVLDELCMRTATENGTSLAVSICIKIMNTKAFCFCATHKIYLTRIAETFLNVTNLYFECIPRSTNPFTLKYTHQLKIGVTPFNNYGLSVAELSNLPKSVLKTAREIVQKLFIRQKNTYKFQRNKKLQELENIYALMAKLYNLIITKQYFFRNISELFKKYFNFKYINALKLKYNTDTQLRNKLRFFKVILKSDSDVIIKKRIILQYLLNISNNQYNLRVFKAKQYNYSNINKCTPIKSLKLLKIKNLDNFLMSKYIKAFYNLKYISLNNQLNSINDIVDKISNDNFSFSRESKHIRELFKVYIKNKFKQKLYQEKKFNVHLFYKNLLDLNLNLY